MCMRGEEDSTKQPKPSLLQRLSGWLLGGVAHTMSPRLNYVDRGTFLVFTSTYPNALERRGEHFYDKGIRVAMATKDNRHYVPADWILSNSY